VEKVFNLRLESSGETLSNPIRSALAKGTITELFGPAVLQCQNGMAWPIDDSAAPIRNVEGHVTGAVMVFRDITDRRKQEQQMELRLREAGHRIRNVFANVRSIMSLCERATQTPEELIKCVDTRMASLLRSTDRLLTSNGSKSSLRDIIIEEVAPYLENETDRLHLSGDDILVGPRASVSLAMIIHELATNAAKHGSLAEKSGRIEVSCQATTNENIALGWTEVRGKQVRGQVAKSPDKTGLGTTLIKGLL